MKRIASVSVPVSFAVLIGAVLPDACLGWSPRHVHRSETRITGTTLRSFISGETCLPEPEDSPNGATRRDALRRTLANLAGGAAASTAVMSAGWVGPASADVTNKIASSSALRALARAQTQLPAKLLPEVKANNYVGVKARLREPPFDNVRKNGQILVRGGEDGPRVKELVKTYKELITALEKIDATASLGMRGRSIDPFEMSREYEVVVGALDSFVRVGAEAAEIPLQAQPSMQENLQTGSITTKVLTGDPVEAPPQSAQDALPTESIDAKAVTSDQLQ